jgi:predicted TIM-barrel fold metal-dependent hydrolase
MPFEAITTLFPAHALIAAADWLWSQVPVRFPKLNIMMAEGGIGWAGMLADRADFVLAHSASGSEGGSWRSDLLPSEVLKRNFWFCSIDDPTAFGAASAIGVDHILVESDYPHADSTWPDTQAVVAKSIGHLSAEDIAKITHLNAAGLFRHPLPDATWLSA